VRRPLAAALAALALALAPATAAAATVSVTLDRPTVATGLGKRFTVRSTIRNTGPRDASGLIAHLNVLSLRSGVYVDPEDWSTQRTRYLDAIPAGGSATVTWRLQAVNAGRFAVYVAVVDPAVEARPPTVGPALRVRVADRRTLDAGGILPLAVGVPAAVGAAAGTLALRRRRRRAVTR
jgi:hypothetical protein